MHSLIIISVPNHTPNTLIINHAHAHIMLLYLPILLLRLTIIKLTVIFCVGILFITITLIYFTGPNMQYIYIYIVLNAVCSHLHRIAAVGWMLSGIVLDLAYMSFQCGYSLCYCSIVHTMHNHYAALLLHYVHSMIVCKLFCTNKVDIFIGVCNKTCYINHKVWFFV